VVSDKKQSKTKNCQQVNVTAPLQKGKLHAQ